MSKLRLEMLAALAHHCTPNETEGRSSLLLVLNWSARSDVSAISRRAAPFGEVSTRGSATLRFTFPSEPISPLQDQALDDRGSHFYPFSYF